MFRTPSVQRNFRSSVSPLYRLDPLFVQRPDWDNGPHRSPRCLHRPKVKGENVYGNPLCLNCSPSYGNNLLSGYGKRFWRTFTSARHKLTQVLVERTKVFLWYGKRVRFTLISYELTEYFKTCGFFNIDTCDKSTPFRSPRRSRKTEGGRTFIRITLTSIRVQFIRLKTCWLRHLTVTKKIYINFTRVPDVPKKRGSKRSITSFCCLFKITLKKV